MAKTWKSDGPEQKYLERLFREKQISYIMRPGFIQKKYPIFNGFSAPVFRKHFSQAKQFFDENGNQFLIEFTTSC